MSDMRQEKWRLSNVSEKGVKGDTCLGQDTLKRPARNLFLTEHDDGHTHCAIGRNLTVGPVAAFGGLSRNKTQPLQRSADLEARA